jgi:hypothetical protein
MIAIVDPSQAEAVMGAKAMPPVVGRGWTSGKSADPSLGYGAMLWLRWKTLSGSYCRLTSLSRS